MNNANAGKPSREIAARQLCLACGICCNGVLFADVELQPKDDPSRLKALGLPLKPGLRKTRFLQPCPALVGCACRIYPDRPQHCRDFECALLRTGAANPCASAEALRLIRRAHTCATRVRELLRQAGNHDEARPLARRFRSVSRQMESRFPSEASAQSFAELTLAVHELNLLLRSAFYPDPAD